MVFKNNLLIYILIFLHLGNSGLFSQKLKKAELSPDSKSQYESFMALLNRYKREGNRVQEADYLNKIAYLFWENGSSEDAVSYFEQSIKINKVIGNENAMQAIYTNIGTIYFDAGIYDIALDYFTRSLEINRKSGKKKKICGNLINIALTNGELNKYSRAIEILDEAYSISKELNDLRLMRTCLGMLYEYYDNLGDKEKSIEYFNRFSAIEKKLQQEAMEKMERETEQVKVEKQQTEKKLRQTYDTLKEVSQVAQKRSDSIENLNQLREFEKMEQDLQDQQREIQLILISLVSGVLVIIILIIYIYYKKNKRINVILEQQNKEISKQRDIIESANKNITNSINYAKRIQKALLPPPSDIKKLIPESFIFFEPRDIVSGDFYWFSETKLQSLISLSSGIDVKKFTRQIKEPDEKGIVVSAVDCTGHGVPGAFMSMIAFNMIYEIISLGITEPNKILSLLNVGIRNQLKQKETDNSDGMDMAICRINKERNILEFSGAKNPLVYVKNGKLEQIKGDFVPIGGFLKDDNDQRNYTKHIIKIDVPTTFYIYTDGFSDQIGGEFGRKFLSKYFRDFLLEISSSPIEKQPELIKARFKKWIGKEYTQIDDILIIGFKLYPNK